MSDKVKVAIIGPGYIGSDLSIKIQRSEKLELAYMIGIQESDGIQRARAAGIPTTTNGLSDAIDEDDIKIFFDCTGAKSHLAHAPVLKERGKVAIDLTPAAVGPYVVPAVNLEGQMFSEGNVNMVTCGGQATIPIIAAVNAVADVSYAEIISSISSASAGQGTRQNIDEFTQTTREAIEEVGGADEAKVIITLNPAEPPIFMRNTIHMRVKKPDLPAIRTAIDEMMAKLKTYVPGYSFLVEPIIEGDLVTTVIQVEGLGDYLPVYAGNLDIINSAALRVGEEIAEKMLKGE